MLNGPGNAHGHVELRRHDLARLTDLPVVGDHAGVDGGAAGADGGVQWSRKLFQQGKVFAGLEAAAATDDDSGGREFGAVGVGGDLFGDPFRVGVGFDL